MYRLTAKAKAARIKTQEARQRGRERSRQAHEPPDYPRPLPDKRRTIIVTDHDFGDVTHTITLHRSRRVDQYRVFVDGKPWKVTGWSGALAGLRKSMPRVMSERACR